MIGNIKLFMHYSVASIVPVNIDIFGLMNNGNAEEETDPYKSPTKHNIRMALFWLVNGCQPVYSLVFHYSGHGSRKRNYRLPDSTLSGGWKRLPATPSGGKNKLSVKTSGGRNRPPVYISGSWYKASGYMSGGVFKLPEKIARGMVFVSLIHSTVLLWYKRWARTKKSDL